MSDRPRIPSPDLESTQTARPKHSAETSPCRQPIVEETPGRSSIQLRQLCLKLAVGFGSTTCIAEGTFPRSEMATLVGQQTSVLLRGWKRRADNKITLAEVTSARARGVRLKVLRESLWLVALLLRFQLDGVCFFQSHAIFANGPC